MKCKACAYQFTTADYNPISADDKEKYILLYRLGTSMPKIAKMAGVSVTSIFNWINKYRLQKLDDKDRIALKVAKGKVKKDSTNLVLEIRIDNHHS